MDSDFVHNLPALPYPIPVEFHDGSGIHTQMSPKTQQTAAIDGVWAFMSYSEADEIPLPSLDLTLRIPDIYDDVVFQSPDS
jgi:hypothetical protein